MRTITRVYRPVGGGWFRDDLWFDAEAGRNVVEPILCAGKGDQTEPHPEHKEYSPDCALCWLGYSHTRAKHQQRIGG